ncbi:MAG: recombination mediator RecR [Candidatus Eisenbacteria bacterium]
MIAFPQSLDRLIRLFSSLPGIGRKSATRIVLRLIESSEAECRELARAIVDARERTRQCSVCGGLTERDPCAVCEDARRDDGLICVVERPSDILALERTGRYAGRYHVLDGVLSPLDGVGPDDLRMSGLVARAGEDGAREVILALNPTAEGEATSLYIGKLLAPLGVRVSRLASGLPVGGDLDLADELTLGTALDERRDL